MRCASREACAACPRHWACQKQSRRRVARPRAPAAPRARTARKDRVERLASAASHGNNGAFCAEEAGLNGVTPWKTRNSSLPQRSSKHRAEEEEEERTMLLYALSA